LFFGVLWPHRAFLRFAVEATIGVWQMAAQTLILGACTRSPAVIQSELCQQPVNVQFLVFARTVRSTGMGTLQASTKSAGESVFAGWLLQVADNVAGWA
jgi:hypothetical protein